MYVFHVMHVYNIYEGLTRKGDIVRTVLEIQNTLHQVIGVFFNSLPSKFESGLGFFSHIKSIQIPSPLQISRFRNILQSC